MHWKDIHFELKKHGDELLVVKGNVFCGCFLFIQPSGVSRAVAVGKALDFDLDAAGKIKVFKGASAIGRLSHDHEMVSEAMMNNVKFKLWVDKYAEQLVVTAYSYNLFLVDKTGLHRFGNIAGHVISLPTDGDGRLRILRV